MHLKGQEKDPFLERQHSEPRRIAKLCQYLLLRL
jgi:hypothetical protein